MMWQSSILAGDGGSATWGRGARRNMLWKRALDLGLGSVMLVTSIPLLVGSAVAMRLLSDHGPFLYRARRVGEGGRTITVLKIRTMAPVVGGAGITVARDARVTPLGRVLRRYRIDELPQLINVVRGDMSLVGPRPEDPRYVNFNDPLHDRVFRARPGITGVSQLAFRDEADVLVGPDAERTYRDVILPAKLRLDAAYLDYQSPRLDLIILAQTVVTVLGQRRRPNRTGFREADHGSE